VPDAVPQYLRQIGCVEEPFPEASRRGRRRSWPPPIRRGAEVVTDFVVDPRIVGADNGWPNVESRVGPGLGRAVDGTRPVELGISRVIGETRAFGLLGEGVFTTWAVSADARFTAQQWGNRGEFFIGQAVGTYNLGIGQSLDPTGFRAIRSVGGWGMEK
jgi:hypothetical protein